MENELFEITRTMNNIKNHDFSVANYKMCKEEADLCIKALELFGNSLKFDKLNVIGASNEATI